ncbi:hypothetical protein TELCIR_03162 [Teladorsagia circumcincta]|uniref:Uncharacterized protein n=1 Tax=Teladorsagia circumcincta TaxID=45464 RepID=A0A2G9UX42_TELCI|nr:hypothetical protein TELCIR_03162 [Teladorsagia circumcincta]
MRSQQRLSQGSITKLEGREEDNSDMMPKSFGGSEPGKSGSIAEFENHWCYHCVSPLKHISSDMRKSIRQFLHLRRTSYPQGELYMWRKSQQMNATTQRTFLACISRLAGIHIALRFPSWTTIKVLN